MATTLIQVNTVPEQMFYNLNRTFSVRYTEICYGNHGGCKMYSNAAKVGVEVNRSVGSQPLMNACAPCEKGRETNSPKCFGSSEVYFCGYMECPYRNACEKLVSAWSLEL
jgi:hypothetical protein